jgi:hypothetical protein
MTGRYHTDRAGLFLCITLFFVVLRRWLLLLGRILLRLLWPSERSLLIIRVTTGILLVPILATMRTTLQILILRARYRIQWLGHAWNFLSFIATGLINFFAR